jgi:hypothetical protein
MNRLRLTLNALALVIFTLVVASAAQAQATRTWVSGVGDDVNPCSRTAPCKTFAGAISKTANKGEINAIDSGGFGTITITKSITIDGAGVQASILAAGTNGVNVNDSASGSPNTIVVHLRNLSINGAGTGFDGIRFVSGRHLFIENVVVFNFKGNGTNSDGLDIAPSTGTNFNIHVKNSTFTDNTGDGIRQTQPVGTLNASYDNVILSGNNNGLEATGGAGSINRSVIDSNSNGVLSTVGAVINVTNNLVVNNSQGIQCNAPAAVIIANNEVMRNGTGLGGAGTYLSFGSNRVLGNTVSDGVTPSPIQQPR